MCSGQKCWCPSLYLKQIKESKMWGCNQQVMWKEVQLQNLIHSLLTINTGQLSVDITINEMLQLCAFNNSCYLHTSTRAHAHTHTHTQCSQYINYFMWIVNHCLATLSNRSLHCQLVKNDILSKFFKPMLPQPKHENVSTKKQELWTSADLEHLHI